MGREGPNDVTARADGDDQRWLSFADQPRLQLDEALARVADLATAVEGAQGRLRSLLRANAAVSADLRLPVVLQHIVNAARDLVSAKYAALGVVGVDGKLEQFIHVGMPADVAERIGALPRGEGVLGMLISHPEPIRLNDLTQHPGAAGIPDHHPLMGSFLGVPIRVGDRAFGNLYLTESATGHFTKDDEQLVVALASSAGVAIENARLYEKSERQRNWLDATARVAQQLLAEPDEPSLDIVLRQALIASGADLACIVLRTGDCWRVVASLGDDAPTSGTPIDLETSLAGRAIVSAVPVILDEQNASTLHEPWRSGTISTAMGAPLLNSDRDASGALSLARLRGRDPFVDDDLQQLIGFTSCVGVAIEFDQARKERELARVTDDRARIAADLHDHVIQVLFATGMSLQSIAPSITPPDVRNTVLDSVEILDDAIKQIRSTIFHLRAPVQDQASLQHRLLQIAQEQAPSLGFNPSVTFTGAPRLADEELSDDVAAVAREGLANVARHAQATHATLEVVLNHSTVTVVVGDDGKGFTQDCLTGGLVNLRRRAEARAGHLRIAPQDSGGTRLTWTARLQHAQRVTTRRPIGLSAL